MIKIKKGMGMKRWLVVMAMAWAAATGAWGAEPEPKTLAEIGARLAKETAEMQEKNPFNFLSKDYFLRFQRDDYARPDRGEVQVDPTWTITIPDDAQPLTKLMAQHLSDFLEKRMKIKLPMEKRRRELMKRQDQSYKGAIELLDSGGGDPATPGSFTIRARMGEIVVSGADAAGLRDGVVKLVDMMGFHEAPIVEGGTETFRPRLRLRLGTPPMGGSMKDLVFLGYNAVFAGGGSLYALSTSNAIPELIARRQAGALEAGKKAAEEARKYGMKTYAFLDTKQKFAKDDGIFRAHPEIRGALTWKADGDYVLCSEHPTVRKYLTESVEGIFKGDPQLDGIVIIIGGEGFYHCFMRPFGVEKGRTNCERCAKLGAETAVANLVNALGEAARKANPKAEVVIWPYSASSVWSADAAQVGLLKKLKPGVALLTEIEKDETIEKEGGIKKALWDYSIDLIGPGERAKQQIAECQARGIPVYLKSEPEASFEGPRLPHIPCMDRWAERAEALASCGAEGAWVFPAFRAAYGTSAMEINKLFWWEPAPRKDAALGRLAARIAGKRGARDLREAWKAVGEAIPMSPEIPAYYTGPYYLGPAHPMCADPSAKLPDVFYGYYLFLAEMTDADGLKKRPTFMTKPTGDPAAFLAMYRKMEASLKRASESANAARSSVDARHAATLAAEASPIHWFYRTVRSTANFYESCMLRDELVALAAKPQRAPSETLQAEPRFERWFAVMSDERANANAALDLAAADPRLDFHYGGDHTFPHLADMLKAKIELLDKETGDFIPGLALKIGLRLAK